MHTKRLYHFIDPRQKLRRVRVTKSYIQQAESLRTSVVDVEDVSNGEKLEGIQITSLLPPWVRPATQPRLALLVRCSGQHCDITHEMYATV